MPYGNRTPYFKNCPICGKNYKLPFWTLKTNKTCSWKCGNELRKKFVHTKEQLEKASKALKGKYVGEKSSQWKGDKVQYESLHDWVRKTYGVPEKCEDCNQIKKITAANISGEYKRDRSDWKFLCYQCHCKFDGKDSEHFRKLQVLSKNK